MVSNEFRFRLLGSYAELGASSRRDREVLGTSWLLDGGAASPSRSDCPCDVNCSNQTTVRGRSAIAILPP